MTEAAKIFHKPFADPPDWKLRELTLKNNFYVNHAGSSRRNDATPDTSRSRKGIPAGFPAGPEMRRSGNPHSAVLLLPLIRMEKYAPP